MITISKITPQLEICMTPVDYFYNGYKFIILKDKENYFDALINIETGKPFAGNIKNNRYLTETLELLCEEFRDELLYNWNLCKNEQDEYKLSNLLKKF